MDSISLLEQHHSYFNENTSNEVKRIFLNKMYLNLLPKLCIIGLSISTKNNSYIDLFLKTSFADGLFVILFYVLLISTAMLYCNYNDISSYDIKPYTCIYTLCFSYLLTYLSSLSNIYFFEYCIVYLLSFNLSVITYTYQKLYGFNYTNLIKISFTTEFFIFTILTFLNYVDYSLSAYLTSSIITTYLVWDTESMITSNNRKFNIKTNQYFLAPNVLYLDIFNIFPWIINTFTGR